MIEAIGLSKNVMLLLTISAKGKPDRIKQKIIDLCDSVRRNENIVDNHVIYCGVPIQLYQHDDKIELMTDAEYSGMTIGKMVSCYIFQMKSNE